MTPAPTDTQTPQGYDSLGATARRILDVAETLGAERGLEAVSVRDVAKEAKVSISVIYHHFGSKGEMLRSVLHWRLEEVHRLRLELFPNPDPKSQPNLDQLLHRIIAPLSILRGRGDKGANTVQFLSQCLLSPQPEIQAEIERSVGDLSGLVDLVQKAVPHLSREDVCWRLHFTIGISRMTHQDSRRLAIMSQGKCDASDSDTAIAKAVAYAKAAFSAP